MAAVIKSAIETINGLHLVTSANDRARVTTRLAIVVIIQHVGILIQQQNSMKSQKDNKIWQTALYHSKFNKMKFIEAA